MKRLYSLLLATIVAATVSLKAQTIVLQEGFENGMPSTWIEEHVQGNQSWVVENLSDGLEYPATVYNGVRRATLRNTSGHTLGYKTRLILPAVDLSNVYQPVLQFSYATPKWTTDVDTLRVFYKNATASDWLLLEEFAKPQNDWKKVEVSLPQYGANYQVCFEGCDGMGRGIVLDSVVVRSMPECTVPSDLITYGMSQNHVTIGWVANFDSEQFEMVVTHDSINPDMASVLSPEELVLHETFANDLKYAKELELTLGLHYWVWIRSICENETSEWSKPISFRMKESKAIPYHETFDRKYTGVISRDDEWSWGNNMNADVPYFSTNVNAVDSKKYSHNGTTHLVFAGSSNVTDPAAADRYLYAATPELTGEVLSDCQVRFNASVYTATSSQYAHKIIVGVMADPEDVSTFTPVDTVSIWGYKLFYECIVSLASYTGEGKCVALYSEFDRPNLFFIDDLYVEKREALSVVSDIYVNPLDTKATITWNGYAASYNVVIANELTENVDSLAASAIVDKATVNAASFTTTALEQDHSWDRPYYVYVQAVDGTDKGDWSYPVSFVTIAKMALPMGFAFNGGVDEVYTMNNVASIFYPKNVGIFSNGASYPNIVTSASHTGASGLSLSKEYGTDAWITFPVTDSLIQSLEMVFYLSGGSKFAQTRATVGVMTNPMDLSTFEQIAEFTCDDNTFKRCYTSFLDYTGKGNIIAICWKDLDNTNPTLNNIDDVTIKTASPCRQVSGIEVTPGDYDATFTWNRLGSTKWQVMLSTSKIPEGYWNDPESYGTVIYNETVIIPEGQDITHTATGLQWNSSYYYYICSICGEEKTEWATGKFTTTCPEVLHVPYLEDFDRFYNPGDNYVPMPCWYSDYSFSVNSSSKTHYPCVYSTSKYSGTHCLFMTNVNRSYGSFVVVPPLDIPVNKTAISMMLSANTVGHALVVGTIADQTDTATFHPYDTLFIEAAGVYEKFEVDFSDYQGTDKQIAFSTFYKPLPNNYVYVDDVLFQDNSCIAPLKLHTKSATDSTAVLTWRGVTPDKWEVLVLKRQVTLNNGAIGSYSQNDILYHNAAVTNREIQIGGLATFTTYYAYVRPTCGDNNWAMTELQTSCYKIDPTKSNCEDFEGLPETTSAASGKIPQCWTRGNLKSTNTTYLPYVYKSTSYATSGTRSMKIYGTTSYYPAWIATPEVDTDDMSAIVLTFGYYASTSYYLIVGTMLDPADLSTFVALDSIKGQGKKATLRLVLNDYGDKLGDGKYIAFRSAYGKTATLYIDDVKIAQSTCPTPRAEVANITDSTARVISNLRGDEDWRILVTDKALDADKLQTDPSYVMPAGTNVIVDQMITDASKSFTLKGLSERTTYYAYLAAFCEGSSGIYSSTTFTTLCKAVPYTAIDTIGFESSEGYTAGAGKTVGCWITGSMQSGSTSYVPYVYNGSSYAHTGSYSLQITSTKSDDGAYAIMPAIEEPLKNLQIRFWAKTPQISTAYAQKLSVGIISDPGDLSTFMPVDTIYGFGTTAYSEYIVSFENYVSDATGKVGNHIAFLSEWGMSNQWYIDDIIIEPITSCSSPRQLTADDCTPTSVSLHWRSPLNKFRVYLATAPVEESLRETYNYLQTQEVTSHSATFTGLKPATAYYVYVQGYCDDASLSQISKNTFRIYTTCPEAFDLPYFNDFDATPNPGTGTPPLCWESLYYNDATAPYGYPNVQSSAGINNSYSLYFNSLRSGNKATYAMLPAMNADLKDCMISFHARANVGSTYDNRLYIGVVTSIDVDSIRDTFIPLDTVEINKGAVFSYHRIALGKFADKLTNGKRIVLADNVSANPDTKITNATYYLDEVKVELTPSVVAPEITATVLTDSTAEAVVVPFNNETQFEVAVIVKEDYLKAAGAQDYETLAKQIVKAQTTTVSLNGLQVNNQYVIIARSINGTDKSEWSRPAYIDMAYYFEDGWFFGFEKSEPYTLTSLASNERFYMHPAIQTGPFGSATDINYLPLAIDTIAGMYGHNMTRGALQLHVNTSYGCVGEYMILPAIEKAQKRQLTFDVRAGYVKPDMTQTAYQDANFVIATVAKGEGFENRKDLVTVKTTAMSTTIRPSAENNWLFEHFTIELDSALLANNQLVIYRPLGDPSSTALYFDNVSLGESNGWSTPLIKTVGGTDSSVKVEWLNATGPWNVYLIHGTGTLESAPAGTVDTVKNVSIPEYTFSELLSSSTYTVCVEAANVPTSDNISIIRAYAVANTACPRPVLTDNVFIEDFDDDTDWITSPLAEGDSYTAPYFKLPTCWSTGAEVFDYHAGGEAGWFIQRPGYQCGGSGEFWESRDGDYNVGRKGSNSIRVMPYGAKENYPYLAVRYIGCDLDTMQTEFYVRMCAFSASTMKLVYPYDRYIGEGSINYNLIVGTLADPTDYASFAALDTFQITAPEGMTSTSTLTDDPMGQEWWRKYIVPLKGAKGNYLAFVAVVPNNGYAYSPIFMDDIKVSKMVNLSTPKNLSTSEYRATSVKLSWQSKDVDAKAVITVRNLATSDTVKIDTVDNTCHHTVTGLQPNTQYEFTVRTMLGDLVSFEPNYVSFYTDCEAQTSAYSTGFEKKEGYRIYPGQTDSKYLITSCWTLGNALEYASETMASMPYNYASTQTVAYAHKGEYALRLYASGTSYQTYAVMPAIDNMQAFDTLQVNFYMRPAQHNPTKGTISVSYATANTQYARSVIVGTCTDPEDVSTFIPLDTLTYSKVLTANVDEVNEMNDYQFEKMSVVLNKATGPYVYFMASLYRKDDPQKYTNDIIYIDDVNFSRAQDCRAPYGLTASNITYKGADLSWTASINAVKYAVEVASDYTFTDVVYRDTLATATCSVDNLNQHVTYYFRVRSICSEFDESEFSGMASFTTLYTPYYSENFKSSNLGSDWYFVSNTAKDMFAATEPITYKFSRTDNYGWRRLLDNYGLVGPHYATAYAYQSGYDNSYMMLSPEIALRENTKTQLTFSLAMTDAQSTVINEHEANSSAKKSQAYVFMVMISADGGQTWNRADATVWSNGTAYGKADYTIADIPVAGQTYRIDLSKYAGKNIKIGFYREMSTTAITTIALHLGNIRINDVVTVNETVVACQHEDINAYGFFVDGTSVLPGTKSFERRTYASELAALNGTADSIVTLTTTILPAPETILNDTICEGETSQRSEFGFPSKQGQYKLKLTSAQGCDSVINLFLSVTPRVYETITEAICPGDTYTMGGKVYDHAGVYVDTLTSAITGCDSIITLNLSYMGSDTMRVDVTIKEEDLPYSYEEVQYPAGIKHITYPVGTAPGTYVDTTAIQGTTCQGVLIHTLTIEPATGLESIIDLTSLQDALKMVINNHLYIYHNRQWYDATGRIVRDPRDSK